MLRATAHTTDRHLGKPAGALRTIGEAALELGVEPYVLRFWQRKFGQLRPVKRSNGRRYYRPEDIDLLRRIRNLLYSEGYTIKGVQRLLDAEMPVPPARQEVRPEPGPRAVPPRTANSAPSDDDAREKVATTLRELRDALALLRQTLQVS